MKHTLYTWPWNTHCTHDYETHTLHIIMKHILYAWLWNTHCTVSCAHHITHYYETLTVREKTPKERNVRLTNKLALSHSSSIPHHHTHHVFSWNLTSCMGWLCRIREGFHIISDMLIFKKKLKFLKFLTLLTFLTFKHFMWNGCAE